MKESFSKRILFNNMFVRIFSLIVAVLFWFIVVVNVSPDSQRTIGGVAVNVEDNAATLTSLGLHAVDKSTGKVTVVVTGPRNLIGSLGSGSFVITPSLGVISKAGSYDLRLSAALRSPDNRIRITKISPAYITVNFDTMLTKTLPVDVQLQNNEVPDGYIMQTPVANPASITLSGPTSELSAISKAVAYVKLGNRPTETALTSSKIVLLDNKGNEPSLDHIEMSNENVSVTVPILKTKDVPLTVAFTNVPPGFNQENIAYTVNPKTILAAGGTDKIESLSEILLGSIDFSTLDINTVKTLDIPDIAGIMNVDSIQSADVTVELKNTSVRMMSTGMFTVLNQPKGYTVTVRTKEIGNIKMFGPSSDIASVTGVTGIIDMADVASGSGQYEVPVSFTVPGRTGYWFTGTYNAVVRVRRGS